MTRELVFIVVAKARKKIPGRSSWRFSARFVGGPHDGQFVDDQLSREDAIGALIRQVAESLGSTDEVLTFVAGLFADLSVRSVNVALARAVWLAASHPRRRNAGVRVQADRPIGRC